jgi:hypothetical protein
MFIPPGTQMLQQFNSVKLFFPTEEDAIIFAELVKELTKAKEVDPAK